MYFKFINKLCVIFFLAVSAKNVAQNSISESDLNWQESFKTAKELAKAENKPLLVFFTGSDWCGPCKRLVADFFNSKKFKEKVANSFIIYKADFPRNKSLVTVKQKTDNYNLKTKYNIKMYPTVLIFGTNDKILGTIQGYNNERNPDFHFGVLKAALRRHVKNAEIKKQ